MVRLGVFTRRRLKAGRGLPTPWARCQYSLLKSGSNLRGASGNTWRKARQPRGNALVDGAHRQLAALTGLESHVIEQCDSVSASLVTGQCDGHCPTNGENATARAHNFAG